MNFTDHSKVICLTKYHHNGGELTEMQVLVERNFRTPLIPAKLISWNIGEAKLDITGYGKYANSSCIVEIDGVKQSWPFSMVYISNPNNPI